MRTLSLAHLTMLDTDPLELLQAAAAGGFNAVGMRILHPVHSPVGWSVIGNPQMQRDIRSMSKDLGVRIYDVESFTLHPDTDPARDLREGLEVAASLGASQVLSTTTDPEPARFREHFSKLCEEAARVGMNVGLEFMMFRDVRTLADALEVIEACGQPNAAVIVDALHLSRSGGTPADVAAIAPGKLAYVQLCDAVAKIPPFDGLIAEARTGRLYPGEGELWLADLIRAIPADAAIGVESPCAKYAHLPAKERAVILGRCTRAVLDSVG